MTMSDPQNLDLDQALAFAEELAHEAGRVALHAFRAPLEVEHKHDTSPVTRVDREIEALLRMRIAMRYPEHGLRGEEQEPERPDARWQWILDPIDGTRSFIAGNPLFGTLIALLEGGRPVLGVIDHPALGERWCGLEGRATTFQGRVARTRACADLGAAFLASTSPYLFPGERRPGFERLVTACADTLLGGDCYLYGLLASGHLDLVCEANLAPHDYSALVPVIEGAGGTISDWQGRALDLGSDGTILAASDARVHAQALALLRA